MLVLRRIVMDVRADRNWKLHAKTIQIKTGNYGKKQDLHIGHLPKPLRTASIDRFCDVNVQGSVANVLIAAKTYSLWPFACYNIASRNGKEHKIIAEIIQDLLQIITTTLIVQVEGHFLT